MYHRIADLDDNGRLAVAPENFAEQVEAIRQCFRPVPLRSLVDGLHDGVIPPRSVAVTFDDGYRDNLVEAKPVLERWDVPATVFVVSGYVGSGRRFWWDELERICTAPKELPDRLELSIGRRARAWSVPNEDERRGLFRALRDTLWALDDREREETLTQLREWSGVGPSPVHDTMDAEELEQLVHDDLVEIGAHSITHPRLPALSRKRQLEEIQGSMGRLSELLDRPVRLFSYPFGAHDRGSAEVVRAAGASCGCTSAPEWMDASTDPYRFPRMHVGNWSADELMERISERGPNRISTRA